jgi:hypothetical protein
MASTRRHFATSPLRLMLAANRDNMNLRPAIARGAVLGQSGIVATEVAAEMKEGTTRKPCPPVTTI